MSTATHKRLSLESELSTLSAELIDAFMDTDALSFSPAHTEQLLKSYIRHVTRCGLAAGRSGLSELQDYCVQFQEILKTLLAQPESVIAQYQAVLEQWPLLLMSYINAAEPRVYARQIHELIAQTAWPGTEATDPNIETPVPSIAASESTVRKAEPLADDEAYQALREELDSIYSALSAQHSQEHSGEAWQHALQQAGDACELFAISAASTGLLGLMDIGNLLASRLHAFAAQADTLADPDWQALLSLHTAMSNYLHATQDAASVETLLLATRQLFDTQLLTQDELDVMRGLLLDRPGDAEEIEVVEAAAPAEMEVELEPEPAAEVTTVQATASDLTQTNLSAEARELIQLVAAEFEQVIAELSVQLHTLGDTHADPAQRNEAREFYLGALARFAEVFESIGLEGMYRLLTGIRVTLQDLDYTTLTSGQQFWLAEWPAHVLNYLTDPASFADELVTHCVAESALLSLDEAGRAALTNALRNPRVNIDEEEQVPRQTVANADDVSLRLPEDVNQQLLDSLLQELPNQTAEFSRVIGNIIHGQGSLHDVDIAQRVAHTLKGSANTVGVAGIANLTHHIEDILLAFTKQKQLPVKPLTNTLQDAADVLEMMSEALLGQGQAPTRQALDVLQQVLDWANQIDLNGLPQASEVLAVERPPLLDGEAETQTAPQPTAEAMLRVSTDSVDETLRLIGESIILNGQLEESLRQILGQNKAIHTQSELFQQLAFELEQLIDVRGMHGILANASSANFDALEMDQYNELHTLTRRLVEAATDSRELTQAAEDDLKALDGLIHQQGRIAKDTQEVVMKTRMLPVQNIIPRLQRSVRQACRLTGKEVELSIDGAHTLIDNDILNSLADPLMHILRNAVDHGIEPAPLRLEKAKPESGRIRLSFAREGEHIMIRCQDDGAGLDYAAIRGIAIERGLLRAEETPSNEALSRLIYVAGLTTRKETTQMSGRGIGMDAVYNQVARMKGGINIVSDAQSGTLVEIQLPVSLISMHGILALARDQVIALSNRSIEQILHADAGVVREEDGQLYYRHDETRYPAYFLEDLLGIMRQEQDLGAVRRPALLLQGKDGRQVIVLVERIITTQDIVIKKLGKYVPPMPGVEGATILGDGSIASVIDLPSVLNSFQGGAHVPLIEHNDLTGIQSGAPKVLVVDDSLSARRSLAEFMHDTGYRVITARDGVEAIEQIEANAPDILLIDMEMPRMNGLELTSYVRANQATRNLPIIMITSRATERHRVEADRAGVNDYLVKPYSEDEVLDKLEAQLSKAFAYHASKAS